MFIDCYFFAIFKLLSSKWLAYYFFVFFFLIFFLFLINTKLCCSISRTPKKRNHNFALFFCESNKPRICFKSHTKNISPREKMGNFFPLHLPYTSKIPHVFTGPYFFPFFSLFCTNQSKFKAYGLERLSCNCFTVFHK